MDDEFEGPVDSENTGDITCPECGAESIASYLDRYGSYEYCTNCDWSDEDSSDGAVWEQIGRRDRGRLDE